MRKTIAIVIGCIALCGLVMAAMRAVPPPKNNLITINGAFETGGVDQPWFVLSKKGKETVQWKNATTVPCTVSFAFGGQSSPFDVEPIPPVNGNGGVSDQYAANKAPDPPKDWEKTKPNDVYIVYKYSVKCGSTTFDPGGGIKP